MFRPLDLLEPGTVVYINGYRPHAVMRGRVLNGGRHLTAATLVHDMPSSAIEQEARVLHAAENVCVVRGA